MMWLKYKRQNNGERFSNFKSTNDSEIGQSFGLPEVEELKFSHLSKSYNIEEFFAILI